MTTTGLIKILQENECGGISHKPREISLTINGKYMVCPQITLSSTGDGVCGPEIDLDIEGEWFEEKEKKGLDKTIKLELNPMEAGYLTSLIYITMDQRPEDKAFLEKVFQRLKKESQVFYEEVD